MLVSVVVCGSVVVTMTLRSSNLDGQRQEEHHHGYEMYCQHDCYERGALQQKHAVPIYYLQISILDRCVTV